MKIKLLLADDQTLFAESLSRVLVSLADDIEIAGIAANGREAVDMAESASPDLVLLDVRMPVMDGVEAARLIHERNKNIRIMMLTTFDDDHYVHEAMKYGASGYLLKDVPLPELVNSIRAIMSGTVQMSPRVLSRLMNRSDRVSEEADDPVSDSPDVLNTLSERELEVLYCLSLGGDNTVIAEKLYLAEQTVKNHLSRIYNKLKVHDRMQARRIAINAHMEKQYPYLARLNQ